MIRFERHLVTATLMLTLLFPCLGGPAAERGNQLLDKKEFVAACEAYREEIRSNGGSVPVHLNLARALYLSKQYTEAMQACDVAHARLDAQLKDWEAETIRRWRGQIYTFDFLARQNLYNQGTIVCRYDRKKLNDWLYKTDSDLFLGVGHLPIRNQTINDVRVWSRQVRTG